MQVILTQFIVLFVVASIALFAHQFVRGLLYTPQFQALVQSPATPVISADIAPSILIVAAIPASPVSYATLEWIHQVDDIETEEVDVIAIARIRMLGIRQLKKLASERKLKGYSKMNKAALILALC